MDKTNNFKLNNNNFRYRKQIKKLDRKLLYTENLKTIWTLKDKMKELERKILINEQQVRFNLMISTSKRNGVIGWISANS